MINNFLKKLSGRERFALSAAVFIISILFLDKIVINPIIASLKALDDSIERKGVKLKANLYMLANKDRILKEAKIYERYSLRALSPEDEMAGLLKEIENLAGKSAVYLINASPSGIREEELLKSYLVKIDCEGQMEQILSFMHSIESSSKMLTVESVRLRPKEPGSSIINCSLYMAKIVMPE